MRTRNKFMAGGLRAAARIALLLPLLPWHPAAAKDLWLTPFAADSPWNTPVARGAQYSAAADPRTQDLLAGHALIHAGQWGMALYLATDGDPWVEVRDEENARIFRARVPTVARPDPMEDGHLFVAEPGRAFVLEMYRARRLGDGTILARRAFRVDLNGPGFFLRDGRFPGVRAMDASGFGGVLRAWELQAGEIRHALTFLLPYTRLKHGPVWPSGREDYWGFRDYAGHVPIGTLAAIPDTVRLDQLGLSPAGLALARALQRYGAYCDDSVGTDGLVLTAENAAETLPALAAMRRDFPVIRRALRVVVSNAAHDTGPDTGARLQP